jgi:long-chain acyl-CoA synthetase
MRQPAYPDFTYQGNDEARRAIDRDGLVTLGDMGYLDAEGYLYICDRSADMVISGGVNIYPAEIEQALIGCPGVLDCAVFGIPDAVYGEQVCAFVQPHPGAVLHADSLRTALGAHLAGYKLPRHIEIVPSLPREDTGKIFKRKLRDPFWAGTGRNI